MKLSLTIDKLTNYLARQLTNSFPDEGCLEELPEIVVKALDKLEYCFSNSKYPPNWKNDQCYFDHLNADQYVIFIYFCSSIAFFQKLNIKLATKFFYLNKIQHSFHCMYDTKLPDIFLVIHGVGIVLGKATYGDYFVVTQGCTVGSNAKHEQPEIGKHVIMYPSSSVIGRSSIGEQSCIASGTFVNDEMINSNSLVIGRSPNLLIKKNRQDRQSNFY